MRTSLEHNERLNLIGALCVSPHQRRIRLRVQGYRTSLPGDEVIAFLKDLLRAIAGPIARVWDKHPIHGRQEVTAFLECHPRIRVYAFPTAAPELNPTEFVWTSDRVYGQHGAAERPGVASQSLAGGGANRRFAPPTGGFHFRFRSAVETCAARTLIFEKSITYLTLPRENPTK